MQLGAALLRRRPNQSLRRRRGRRQLDPSTRGRGEEAATGTGVRRYLCRQRPLGVSRWYSRASWKVSVRIKAPVCRWRLEDRQSRTACRRPFYEPATSTARRIAAATWMMSSTTVASRAYTAVPARRSRCSRGASRTSSAPAAGSARHRADAGRGAARSPDAQPASCRRSFPCDFPARTAPSTRHRWRPRPDRQSLPGCAGRDVLAGAFVPTPGPAGAVPVRVRSGSDCRASLEERKALASAKTASADTPGRSMRRTPVRGSCTSTVRPWNPVATAIAGPPSQGTVPERRANVQKGARLRGPAHVGSGGGPKRGGGGARRTLSPLKTHWRGSALGHKPL